MKTYFLNQKTLKSHINMNIEDISFPISHNISLDDSMKKKFVNGDKIYLTFDLQDVKEDEVQEIITRELENFVKRKP